MANGQKVSSYSEGTDQFDVYVQADEPFRRSREDLKNFTVTSSKGGLVSLDQLVTLQEDKSAASIARLNRQRQVTVTANVAPSTSEADAVQTLQRYAQELNMGPEYQTGVTGQSKEYLPAALPAGAVHDRLLPLLAARSAAEVVPAARLEHRPLPEALHPRLQLAGEGRPGRDRLRVRRRQAAGGSAAAAQHPGACGRRSSALWRALASRPRLVRDVTVGPSVRAWGGEGWTFGRAQGIVDSVNEFFAGVNDAD